MSSSLFQGPGPRSSSATAPARTAAPWLALLLPLLAGCGGEAPPPGAKAAAAPERPVPVRVEPVVHLPEQVRLEAVGTSRALRSVVLHPAAAGEVTAVQIQGGRKVAAGALLLALDDRAEQLAVELARVQLEEAQRALGRLEGSRQAGAVTRAELESARAAVEAARIELRRAEVALDDRTLEAPFAGVVGLTDIDLGARVTPETAVTTLDDRSALLVRFEVPESLSGRLAPGDPVTLTPWTGAADQRPGRIVQIDSRIDPVSRTFLARAELPDPAEQLRPGMSFRVALTLEGPRHPAVPEVALQWGGEGAFVWRVEAGRAVRVPVTLVERREGRVLVAAELPPGALVVREGVQRLRSGSAVTHPPATAGAAP